jgi:hypothetical protein
MARDKDAPSFQIKQGRNRRHDGIEPNEEGTLLHSGSIDMPGCCCRGGRDGDDVTCRGRAAGTAWSTKRYLNIELLKDQQMIAAIVA